MITEYGKNMLVYTYEIDFLYKSYTPHSQEYPTEPLDKIPARQAEFELAGKKKHWLVSWLGNLNERLAS